MEEKLTKELAQKLMEIKGEVRGLILKQDLEYVISQKGKEGLEKIEDQLAAWGYPVKYREVKQINFYPAGLRALTLLAMKEVFGWECQETGKVCAYHLKASLAMRLFMKYLYSISRILEKSSMMWREYWTVGEFKTVEFNKKEKYVVVRLENFDLHPIFCCCLRGYLEAIAGIVVRSPKITCREIECFFKGDKYHEYLIKWQ